MIKSKVSTTEDKFVIAPSLLIGAIIFITSFVIFVVAKLLEAPTVAEYALQGFVLGVGICSYRIVNRIVDDVTNFIESKK
ncbi:hypothetical protein DSM106972_096520 [Dulcicalothrix desertica PCC 7102]|uniref:Uncharacterized protein n=1 Tax=Dulcicalothrix desertica PCC 7102 TaxID=232991 RepID=A0A3S1I7M1_9CYAN|nr:hypothetical protein DSM106972_096520 [Dulcicalothrix desertica PCC 7102]